ncbi:hypothetical protein NPIL_188011 [Nephila pilipes]|uniref:Uncharacterized protein n=1 Tax=Nephila pilipes TaxID=299642 RepID=A0A8X6UJQ3_NEPPI|nr:hypothetical protein NPIL_188011 [Nephila pilipes]
MKIDKGKGDSSRPRSSGGPTAIENQSGNPPPSSIEHICQEFFSKFKLLLKKNLEECMYKSSNKSRALNGNPVTPPGP